MRRARRTGENLEARSVLKVARKVSMNAFKHGHRSKRMAFFDEVSYSSEARRLKWMAGHDAGKDMEEYLIARNAVIASKLDRIERADAEGFRSCVETFDEKEREEALALVRRLFHNPSGSPASYGIGPQSLIRPKPSFSGQPVEVEEPAAIVEKLESSECGTRLLLDAWDILRERLEPEKFWQSPDRFRAIRLLKHQPADAPRTETSPPFSTPARSSSPGGGSRSGNCAATSARVSLPSFATKSPIDFPSWRNSRSLTNVARSLSTSSTGISRGWKRSWRHTKRTRTPRPNRLSLERDSIAAPGGNN